MIAKEKSLINHMLRSIFLLGIALFLWNCETDSNQSGMEMETYIKEVSADLAMSELSKSKAYLDKSKSKNFDNTIGQINKEKMARIIKTEKQTSNYTFTLKKETSNFKAIDYDGSYYSDHLFVNIDSLNQMSYQIFRYIPTNEWLNDTTANLSTYTGKVQVLSTDRVVVASMDYHDGIEVLNNTKSRVECRILSTTIICTGAVYPGYGDLCSVTYDVSCTGASGGGYNFPDPTPSNPSDGDSGGGGSSDNNDEDEGSGSSSGSPDIRGDRPDCTGGKMNSPIFPFTCICPSNTTEDVNGVCVEEDQIENELDDPCASNIFTQLEIQSLGQTLEQSINPETNTFFTFSESILQMFNGSDVIHLTILNGNIGNSNAHTIGSTITIDNDYLNYATQLSIARTMIHETVHAYINSMYSNPIEFNSFSFREKLNQYAEDNGYSVGTNEFHHEFMSEYLDAMAISLLKWDIEYGTGGVLGWDYYLAMAWGGMFQVDSNGNVVEVTDTFQELVPNANDRQIIADIVINEQNGNNEAFGTECD